jgi:hypothetical protein
MNLQAIPDRVREFFVLQEAERGARSLPDADRALVLREVGLASQRRQAAETLWPRGSGAEALKLVTTSFDALGAGLGELAGRVDPVPPWLAKAQAALAGAKKQTADQKRPELESEVTPEHEAVFQGMVDALVAAEEAIGPHVATPAQFAALRRQRALTTIFSALGLVLFAVWALHKPAFSHAEATTTLGEHAAERAIDGETRTWWVVPPGQQGSLDLTLGGPRTVGTLKIVGSNPPENNHITKDARIEAFLEGKLVKTADVTFRPVQPGDVDWVEVHLDAPRCDRIRITTLSTLKESSVIGEVELH